MNQNLTCTVYNPPPCSVRDLPSLCHNNHVIRSSDAPQPDCGLMLDINSRELHSGKPSKAQILIMSPARLRGDVTEGAHISLVSSTSCYCIIVSVRFGDWGLHRIWGSRTSGWRQGRHQYCRNALNTIQDKNVTGVSEQDVIFWNTERGFLLYKANPEWRPPWLVRCSCR